MAIQLVTFDNKENLNTEQDVPRINKVIDDDMNQLKNVANTNANNVGDMVQLNNPSDSLVGALNVLNYNIITNGQAVKTGRKIDGKDEYVKRYKINIVAGTINGNVALGFNLASVTVSEMKGYIVYNNGSIYNLDTNNYRFPNDYTYMYLNSQESDIRIFCATPENYSYAVVEIYFVYN